MSSSPGSSPSQSHGRRPHQDEGELRLVRRRLTIACINCRSRKRKCSGEKPECLQCRQHSVHCAWPAKDLRKFKLANGASRDDSAKPAPVSLDPSWPTFSTSPADNPSAPISAPIYASNTSATPIDRLPHPSTIPTGTGESSMSSLPTVVSPGHGFRLSGISTHESAWQPSHMDGNSMDRSGATDVVSAALPVAPVEERGASARAPMAKYGPTRLSYEYIRPYGPTAIRPGLGRLRLSLRGNAPRLANVAQELPRPVIVDPQTRLPHDDLRYALLSAYFDHFSSTFPFLDRVAFMSRLGHDSDAETILLANTMCALSARFSNAPDIVALSPSPYCRGVPFADNAKQLLIPMLSMPSANTTAALLFLAWYEFGMNSEGGLWNYSGMAIRMAVDLGLHRQLSRMTPRSNRTLFWCIYILDRTLAIGTGRTTSLPDRQIDIADPDDDVSEARSSDRPSATFAYVVKLTRLYGRIAEIVNESPIWLSGLNTDLSAAPTRAHSPAAATPSKPSQPSHAAPHTASAAPASDAWHRIELVDLSSTEDAVYHLYESLPPSLTWSEENLRQHVERGDGEIFVHLHLWHHCIIAILYREPLLQARATFAGMSTAEALEIQKQAAKSIHDITVVVFEQYPQVVLNQPFINQCFYTSACTWLADIKSNEGPSNRALARLRATAASSARSNFTVAARVLRAQSEFYAGVGWIAASLAKRGAGLSLQEMVNSGVTDTILSSEEMRILTSYAAAENPDTPALMDLWSSIMQSGISTEDNTANGEICEPLWGADGLFDADADQLLFGLGETSTSFNSLLGSIMADQT